MDRSKNLLDTLIPFQTVVWAQDGGDPEEQSSEGCKWQQHKRRGDWWSSQFSHALIIYYSQDCSAAESTKDAPKDRTTLVVFIGLLIDLLGEKKLSKWPQCTIVFLFSFHPDSASLSCSDWPLQRKWFQWFVRIFGDQGTFFNSRLACKDVVTRLTVSAAWWEPRHNSTPCCLVDSSAVSSLFFR